VGKPPEFWNDFSTVVPAKAGTHTPCALDRSVAMGSRFRGNDR
jgi:hypothetical protein